MVKRESEPRARFQRPRHAPRRGRRPRRDASERAVISKTLRRVVAGSGRVEGKHPSGVACLKASVVTGGEAFARSEMSDACNRRQEGGVIRRIATFGGFSFAVFRLSHATSRKPEDSSQHDPSSTGAGHAPAGPHRRTSGFEGGGISPLVSGRALSFRRIALVREILSPR